MIGQADASLEGVALTLSNASCWVLPACFNGKVWVLLSGKVGDGIPVHQASLSNMLMLRQVP